MRRNQNSAPNSSTTPNKTSGHTGEFLHRGRQFTRELGNRAVDLALKPYVHRVEHRSYKAQRQRDAERDRRHGLRDMMLEHTLLTDDKEILGSSDHFGRNLRQTTMETTNTIHAKYVDSREHLAKPRNKYLEYRHDRLKLKARRLESKLDEAYLNREEGSAIPDTLWNRHLRRKHENVKKRTKWRKGQLKTNRNAHTKRTEKLGGKYISREEKRQLYIDGYIKKAIDHERNKMVRERMRDKGIKPRGRSHEMTKRRLEFLKNLTIDDKRQIVKTAMLNIRQENIRSGKLSHIYTVNPAFNRRKIDEYARAIN